MTFEKHLSKQLLFYVLLKVIVSQRMLCVKDHEGKQKYQITCFFISAVQWNYL